LTYWVAADWLNGFAWIHGTVVYSKWVTSTCLNVKTAFYTTVSDLHRVRHPINSASLTRQCAAKFNIIDNNNESGASSYELFWNKGSKIWTFLKENKKDSAKR